MEKNDSVWFWLKNTILMVSKDYKDLKYLESPVCEILDEIDTAYSMGLSDQSLRFFIKQKWLNEKQKKKLKKLKESMDNLENKKWNLIDFDNDSEWLAIKKIAKTLKKELNLK